MSVYEEILAQIADLSSKDKKTLSQKALKVCEEAGELASVVLPYDNAAGTLHRFITEQQIVEEAVDVILCAASILTTLNCDCEDIAEMFNRKLSKWGALQNKEQRINDCTSIPFEMHVTVKLPPERVHHFIDLCDFDIGVKPIVIDLDVPEGEMRDVMTSSTIFGDNHRAMHELTRISELLERHGYMVVRKKIETVPWHPNAPQTYGDVMPKNCYFESHIPILIHTDGVNNLRILTKLIGLHLSRNAFKKIDDQGNIVIMATLRMDNTDHDHFVAFVNNARESLNKMGYKIVEGRVVIEFAIYDTNVSHDEKWTSSIQIPLRQDGPYGKNGDQEELYSYDDDE